MMKGQARLSAAIMPPEAQNDLATAPAPHPGNGTGHPDTNQPSRRYAEALDLHEPFWGRPGMRGFSRICGNRGIESAVCPLS